MATERTGRAAWRWAVWVALPAGLALVTAAVRAGGAHSSTAGFLYLLLVLGLAAWGGAAVGTAAAVAATLAFNYFFLPPFHTLTVADPQNWVALACFLTAAVLASRLVASARAQAAEAQRRRREAEALYDLCFGLFAASQRPGALGEAAAHTLRALGGEAGRLLLGGPGAWSVASEIGGGRLEVDPEALDHAFWKRRVVEAPEEPAGASTERIAYVPLEVGGPASGVLAVRNPRVTRAVLESAGRLLALAVERERLLGEAAHLEAMRESEALRTALLRAVSHDLRTPLTAIRLEVESLGRQLAGRPDVEASLGTLGREQERLARRIDNLLALARLDAGLARPHPDAVPPSALLRAACDSLALVLDGRPVEVRVSPRCPDLWVDPSLGLEMVVNLVENAARASSPGQGIELAAAPAPGAPERVRVEIRDRGPGVPSAVRRLLQKPRSLERAGGSADAVPGGLGLQIAGSFAAAQGGALALLDRAGGGTIARLDLPAAPQLDVAEEEA
jgi:two-component system, OmpR family, sensor histidine kinase KdpD